MSVILRQIMSDQVISMHIQTWCTYSTASETIDFFKPTYERQNIIVIIFMNIIIVVIINFAYL